MTDNSETARALVDELGKDFPNALELARVVSIASRVEPELLRKARLKLLPPRVDAGAEADLWFSPLVQSSTPLALTFIPEVADLLRHELAKSRESLQRAWEVLEDVHAKAPAAIKLEERVTWRILEGKPDAYKAVEDELMSVVSAIVNQNRTGLARWALRAVPKLPEEARQTQAAQTLLITAAAHLNAWHLLQKQVESNTLSPGFINNLKVVLRSDLRKVEVGVRLLDETDQFTELGLESVLSSEVTRRRVIEFSSPPASDKSDLIRVPGTNPLLLEVTWNATGGQQLRNLSLYQGRVETIKVDDAGTVTIRTAGGDIYTLSEVNPKDPGPVSDPRSEALARIPSVPSIGYITRLDPKSGKDIVEEMNQKLPLPGAVRAVRIYGEGGVGKTTVAAELARGLLGIYDGRVVWLSAAGRSDFNLNFLLDGIATQLGRFDLRRLNPKAKTLELSSLLRTRPPIVFVDDFEIVPRKEQIRCLNFLSRHCLSVIISRAVSVRRRNELEFYVQSMSVDEAREFLERTIDQSPANTLIRKLADPSQIAVVCDRIPLAMQLFVAQVEFTKKRPGAFKKLQTQTDSALTRVFDLSFNLPELGVEGRAALLALSLFVPSASKEALTEVAGIDQAQSLDEIANRLRTLKLVCEVSEGKRLAIDGFVRSAVETRLQPAREKQFKRRFVKYFLSYVEQHTEATAADYDALEAEFENLLDAMDMAEELKSWDELVRICIALSRFLDVRGYWDESLRRNKQAQTAARTSKRTDMLPHLYETAGDIYLRRGDFSNAENAFRSILRFYASHPLNVKVATATRQLGSIAFERKDLKLAESFYAEALAISRQLKLEAGVADNLHNLAIVMQLQGDFDRALELYQESLKISERLGDQRSIAISLHQLGVVAREQGRNAEARKFFEQSLNTKRQLGDRNGMADTLHQLGLLLVTLGEKEQAEYVLRQALGIYEQLGSPSAGEVDRDLSDLTRVRRSARKRRATKSKRPTSKSAPAKQTKRVVTAKKRPRMKDSPPYMIGGGRLDGKAKTAKKVSAKKTARKRVGAKKPGFLYGGLGRTSKSRFRRSGAKRVGRRSGTVLR